MAAASADKSAPGLKPGLALGMQRHRMCTRARGSWEIHDDAALLLVARPHPPPGSPLMEHP